MSSRRKSRVVAILATLVSLACVVSPVIPQDAAPLRLRVVVRQKYPLLFTAEKTPDRPEGMAIDILKAIGKRSGISFSWVILPADADVAESLRRRQGDFAADWGETAVRKEEFAFSSPYVTLPVCAYVRKESSVLRDARRLEGLRVGVVARNVADEMLSPRADLALTRYDTIYDALFHLLSGDIDALVHLGPILLEEARVAGIEDKIMPVEPALADSRRGFAARQEDAAVLARLDEGLKDFVGTPEYQRIYLKWFPPPKSFWTGRRVLALNGAVFFLLAVVLGGRHYSSLRRLNRALSEGKRLEEELRKSEVERMSVQKYEAVGKLAAGMAHHINNLMTVVSGYGSLLLRNMEPFDPHRKEIREMMYAGDRAAALAAQLLAFSRQTILLQKVEPIDALVDGRLPAVRTRLGDGITLSVRKEAGAAAVRVDERPFGTLIEELVKNAGEAMPAGGRIEIATGVREVGKSDGKGGWSPDPGLYATVSVADTGCGMDEEALSHLFEPFYTTKGFGRGMGLPSAYGFVKQCSGFIEVESAPGRGTTVTVCLPLVSRDPLPKSPAGAPGRR